LRRPPSGSVPILLTTGTTICGLLPMVFEMSVNFGQGAINFGGSEAEWWVQLATAVVFGLAFSTIMILLVTPVWLLVPHRTGNMIRRISTRIRGQRPADEVRLLQNGEPANDKVEDEKRDSALPAAE
jgi:multidrug efflux pump